MQGFVAVVFLAVAVISAYGCPGGWESKAGKCYKFVARNRNFHDAEKECKRDGGHLACPQTKAENEAIHALAKRR